MRRTWTARIARGSMVTVAVGGLAAVPAVAAARDDAQALSKRAVAEDARWRAQLQDPSAIVYPAAVHVEGDAAGVTGADGLRAAGGGVARLTSSGAGTTSLVVDLGSDVGGRFEVGLTATDGTAVRLGYSERREFLTPYGDTVGSPSVVDDPEPNGRSDVIATAGRPVTWTSPGVRGAQRWVRIQLEGAGSVSIDYVRVRVNQLRPAASDYTGRFLSSDKLVNRIWWANAYTLNLGAIQDDRPGAKGPRVLADGAKRDHLADIASTLPASSFYTTAEHPRIVRDTLALFPCQQHADGYIPFASDVDIPCPGGKPGRADGPPAGSNPLFERIRLGTYTAGWVVAVDQYVQYTGDVAFARAMLPVIRRALTFMEAHAVNGLYVINNKQPLFEILWHPDNVNFGAADTYTNAIWLRALNAAARTERLLGHGAQADAYAKRASTLRQAMVATLWDAAAGAFRVGAPAPVLDHAQDANVESILAGAITGTNADRALDYLVKHLSSPLGRVTSETTSDPRMSQYIAPNITSDELIARFTAGDGAGAMDLIRTTWGHFVRSDPAGPAWERLGLDGRPYRTGIVPGSAPQSPGQTNEGNTSLAHPWGAGPVAALSAYVLGLRPASPGWRTWTVAPQPTDLRWAQGQAGTPHGTLASRWARGAGDASFRLTVAAPKGTRGSVSVPTLGAARTIAMDGKVVWRGGRAAGGFRATKDHGAVTFAGISGTHTFAWAK